MNKNIYDIDHHVFINDIVPINTKRNVNLANAFCRKLDNDFYVSDLIPRSLNTEFTLLFSSLKKNFSHFQISTNVRKDRNLVIYINVWDFETYEAHAERMFELKIILYDVFDKIENWDTIYDELNGYWGSYFNDMNIKQIIEFTESLSNKLEFKNSYQYI